MVTVPINMDMNNRAGQETAPSKSTTKLFNELLESAKTLPSTSSELGSIQLSITEINRRAKELRSHHSEQQKNSFDHTKAHYLLAGSGLAFEDVDSSLKALQDHTSANTYRNNQQVATNVSSGWENYANGTTEIDRYLRNKKDENILSSIELLLSNAAKDFDNFVNQNLNLDWNERKNMVRENFSIQLNNSTNSANHTTSHLYRSKDTSKALNSKGTSIWNNQKNRNILSDCDSKLNVNEHYIIREKFETYARIIHRYNNTRQSGLTFPLSKEFMNILINSTDFKNKQLFESWKILDSLKFSGNKITNNKIVENSKNYLQTQFLEYVDLLYKKKMDEGLPTEINKIKSFIDSKLKNQNNTWKIKNLTIVNGIPIWALIFYLLRAGLIQEALEVAVNNKSSFKKVEQSFLSYFKAYAHSSDSKLPVEFSTKLHTEYNQHIKSAINGDPYRLAVYKIIGRCDLTRKNISSVTLNIEDWLWIHLMLVKDDVTDEDPVYERYTLEDFQNIIISYGPDKFNNSYLQNLILSGLYELAVEFAYSINEIDAVHLAVGLANLNLLNVSSLESLVATTNKNEDQNKFNHMDNQSQTNYKFITTNSQGQREINFAKILASYTKSFRFSDPKIATEYLILISLINNQEQIEICHEALRELVLETKEFTILLGKISRDGTRIPGVIEERQPLLHLKDEKEYLRIITEQAARKADEDGRVNDSLLLYQLSGEYDIVVSIVNGLLSDILSNSDLNQPLLIDNDNSETNPILLAKKLILIYIDNLEIAKQVQTKNKETCILLLNLVKVRKTFLANQWQNTLSQLEEIDLLPFSDELSARRKAQDFTTLNENIIKCIPNLLIITMTCIAGLIKSLNESEYQSTTKQQQITSLKNVAKNCMVYAGMIQYKMPRETYSTLINLDVGL